MFIDRRDAGKMLIDPLKKFNVDDSILLAVPRGGVVTAYDVIKELGFNWDMIIPRKIGAPFNPEVAIGAVASDGSYILNETFVERLNISQDYIDEAVASEVNEINRRMKEYRGKEEFPNVENKTAIIIDDGIATGFTIEAAIHSVKNQGAIKIILAVPVAPEDTIARLESVVDEVICLFVPEDFHAVGLYYEDFKQVTDKELFNLLKELR